MKIKSRLKFSPLLSLKSCICIIDEKTFIFSDFFFTSYQNYLNAGLKTQSREKWKVNKIPCWEFTQNQTDIGKNFQCAVVWAFSFHPFFPWFSQHIYIFARCLTPPLLWPSKIAHIVSWLICYSTMEKNLLSAHIFIFT